MFLDSFQVDFDVTHLQTDVFLVDADVSSKGRNCVRSDPTRNRGPTPQVLRFPPPRWVETNVDGLLIAHIVGSFEYERDHHGQLKVPFSP